LAATPAPDNASAKPTAKSQADEWRRVALAVARSAGKRIGLDTATRMATDAELASDADLSGGQGKRRPSSNAESEKVDPIAELRRIVVEK
jgi:hypothetical protein